MKMKKELENIGYDKFDVILLDGGHEINDQEIEKRYFLIILGNLQIDETDSA